MVLDKDAIILYDGKTLLNYSENMKIGIIGLGVVGSAVKHGFERIGHSVEGYDIKYPQTSLKNLIGAELCFICVPTPTSSDGGCDISIVEEIFGDLSREKYTGLTVIKSTVIPGTTESLAKKFTNLRCAFCPEFLRERAAYTDFVENHDLCVIGTFDDESYHLIKEAHGPLPKKTVRLTPTEAEFSKYFSNIFNALRITFANEFYEVCKAMGVDYSNIKNAMVFRNTINDAYLDCNENFRGFGGVCLPKDTEAFASFVKKVGVDMNLFDLICQENKKFRKTIPNGMRE